MDNLFDKIRESEAGAELPVMPKDAWEKHLAYQNVKENPKAFLWYPYVIGSLIALLLISNIAWWSSDETSESITSHVFRDTVYVYKNSPILNGTNQENVQSDLTVGGENFLGQTSNPSFQNRAHTPSTSNELKQAIEKITNLENRVAALNQNINQVQYEATRYALHLAQKENEIYRLNHALLASTSEESRTNPSQIIRTDFADGSINTGPTIDESLSDMILKSGFPIQNSIERKGLLDDKLRDVPSEIDHEFSLGSFLTPKYYTVGLDLGFIKHYNQKYGDANGIATNLNANVYFSDRLRLSTRGSVSLNNSVIRDLDRYDDLPPVMVPEQGNLKYLTIRSFGTHLDLGFDYIFLTKKRTQPYLGAGYSFHKNRYRNFNYEFNTVNGELYVTAEDYKNTSNVELPFGNIGLEYVLSKKLNAKLEGTYYFYPNKDTGEILNLKSGLYYKF